MTINANTSSNKQAEQAEKFNDAVKASIDKGSDQRAHFADAARDDMKRISELNAKAAENAKHIIQKNVDTASQQVREASDHMSRTLGFTGEDSARLALQSKQNIEAVTRCGTVLTQAVQDASRHWFEIGQKQWQRNLNSLNKLTRATSVQEFTAIQSELIREGLQHMVQDSKALAEGSVRAVEDASKAFNNLAQQSSSPTPLKGM